MLIRSLNKFNFYLKIFIKNPCHRDILDHKNVTQCILMKVIKSHIKNPYRDYCDCSKNLNSSSKMEVDKPSNFFIDKRPFTSVSEGSANVDFPSTQDVFYNPVQEFNRDMSVVVLRLHASDYKAIKTAKLSKQKETISHSSSVKISENDFKQVSTNTEILPCGEKDDDGIKILEALAASGLRSIRYAKEVGGIAEIIANDISTQAVECMKENMEKNGVHHIVKPSQNDASLIMYQNREFSKRFSAIDLDPYGSPHTFLDGAVQSVVDGGLLLVTCTDMAVLCGNSPETCYLKYGAISMKHMACHEIGIRIILQCIEANANKYGRYIVPLLSMSVDFYVRVFVRIFTSQLKCKESFSKRSWINRCTRCESTTFQQLGHVVKHKESVKYHLSTPTVGPTCPHCGGTHRTGGPIWTDPIHDQNFVSRLKATISEGTPLGTLRRIEGTLTLIEEELPDVPLYVVFDKILKVLRMSCFKMKEFSSAILNAGYRVSPTHAARNGLKTDAPYSVIWDILRARERLRPICKDKLPDDHPAKAILRIGEKYSNSYTTNTSEHSSTPISFEIHPGSMFESVKSKVLRFQVNPHECWGPKARSVTSLFHGDLQEKSKRKQGMRKRYKRLKCEGESTAQFSETDKKENEEPI